MYYLIYSSYASYQFTEVDLKVLLVTSQQQNTKTGITGMMYYFSNQFLQLIEGENDDVRNLYEKIRDDNRHHDVVTLKEGFIDTRFFANWTMGFKALSPDDLNNVEGYKDLSTPGGANTMDVLRLLKLFS